MRWVIVNTDYPEFLHALYAASPSLHHASCEEQLRVRRESLFGVADFYSSNLRELGHEAWEVYANNVPLQRAWARENGMRAAPRVGRRGIEPPPVQARQQSRLATARHLAGRALERLGVKALSLGGILAAQLAHYRPDVILNQAIGEVDEDLLRVAWPHALLVGQIASPLPTNVDFRCYELVVSSLPNFVAHFRGIGVASELNRLAFEPRVLSRLGPRTPSVDVSFVGSISPAHAARIAWLEQLCRELGVDVWGPGVELLPKDSAIRAHHRGQAWGLEMYETLRVSKIALNSHIDVAAGHANNMRLFEATGAGTLLITDHQQDLHEIFKPGREVVSYRTSQECVALVRRYLVDDREREAIAQAGQARTLRDHTYRARMAELAELCSHYVAKMRREPRAPKGRQ